MKKCIIIMNPESGKVKSLGSKKEFYDILRKHGYDAEIRYTKAKRDAIRIVEGLDDDVDLVISAGGDGTLNEVVTGNLKRENKLTLANVYVACLGDYIDMAYSTPRDLKKKYGKIAYILYGLRQLRNSIHRYRVKYKVDGVEHKGEYSFFFITNSSRVAGVDDIYYDVKMDDNMFEVALANPKTKADILRMLVQVTMKDVKEVPGITYYQTNDFEIEFLDRPKTSWCIDGEEYLSPNLTFKFKVDQKVKMLIPKTNAKKLFEE